MDPLEPQPPRPVPPAPPRPELVPPLPRPPAAASMLEFFQKRIEALERELAAERERASAASNQLVQQEALKNEVESHLKSMTEQLRREKAEREGEDAKSHARGRVEALERRLDEMNSTFAQLLKEAVARQPPAAALLPEMRGIEEQLSRRFEEFAAGLKATLSDWERRHDQELRRQDDRLQSLADERAALSRMWQEQGQSLRQEFLKERIARETAVSGQIAEITGRLDAADRGRREAEAASVSVREALERITRLLAATPKAKDEIIVELEAEKNQLLQAMRERHDQLRAALDERREVEKTMGDSLVSLSGELERERARTRVAQARSDGAQGDLEALNARVADLERSLAERDARALSLGAERDELTRALVGEAEKVRVSIAERAASDERWHQRVLELQRRVEEESALARQEAERANDLRAKVATLSEHMARALQERDGVVARFADWERERQRLLDVIKQKDGMVSMLSSAFQGSLKKP
ncbi:MAG: hypothetical protein HY403_05830 [Elusimicrobia bacterium]|nr:hypothetical protein [Elusimicrobiota bacterium]